MNRLNLIKNFQFITSNLLIINGIIILIIKYKDSLAAKWQIYNFYPILIQNKKLKMI